MIEDFRPKQRTPKYNERFDRDETPDLIAIYRGQESSGKYPWMKRLTPSTAKEELLYRFHRLIATIVECLITGRPNYFSSYQITFLRLFAGKAVPLEKMAGKLKKELSCYSKEELFGIGQAAFLLAIERTKTNLVSTFVMCFKDEIFAITKNQDIDKYTPITEETILKSKDFEDDVLLEVFLDSLPLHEKTMAQKIIDGEYKGTVPNNLKRKLIDYLGLN